MMLYRQSRRSIRRNSQDNTVCVNKGFEELLTFAIEATEK
jgi:hypothetical protein